MNRNDMPRFANIRSQAEIDSEDARARRDALTTALAHFLIILGIGIMMTISIVSVYGAIDDQLATIFPLGNLPKP